jgi:dihydropyrimidinase
MDIKFFDLVIKNGLIINADSSFYGDVAINKGKVAVIGNNFKAKNVIDAKGLYILPGGIDVHTHFDMPFMGTFSSDDFTTGSQAAACGGTTTVIDYAMQAKGESLNKTICNWHKKSENKTYVDYGFHLGLTDVNEHILNELKDLSDMGVTTVKLFMAYNNTLRCPDLLMLEVFNRLKMYSILPMLHCENGDIVEYLSKKLLKENKTAAFYHSIAHSPVAEAEAIFRAVTYSDMFKLPIYVVHLSSKEGLQVVYDALNKGEKVFVETCPQYLLLSECLYENNFIEASKYVMSPPLRDKASIDALWIGISKGVINVIATDHCPFFLKQKEMGSNDFTKIPNGVPGVENRLAIVFSEGVNKGRITKEKFVEICCLNPAKLTGLYPQKGLIAPNFDADLVMIDPDKKWKITKGALSQNVDYTPFEGLEITGSVVNVFLRGNQIVGDGSFIGSSVRGKYLKRRKVFGYETY